MNEASGDEASGDDTSGDEASGDRSLRQRLAAAGVDPGPVEALADRLSGHSGVADAVVRALCASADPARACGNLVRLVDAHPRLEVLWAAWAGEPAAVAAMVAAVGASQALADVFVTMPAWADDLVRPGAIDRPIGRDAMRDALAGSWAEDASTEDRLREVRRFRRAQSLRIGVADIAGRWTTAEVVGELSDVADLCIEAVLDLALEEVGRVWGHPGPADGVDPGIAVISMGKLGGCELNYSSDIDLLFVYEGGGATSGGSRGGTISVHEFYNRVAAELVRMTSERTGDGWLYRVDARLRPEGDNGPLVPSLLACEAYYGERADTWERLAMTKARVSAGAPGVGAAFLEISQGYAYGPLRLELVLDDVARVKRRIEDELLADAGDDVKLGPGGIRDIEFIVQTMLILHGSRDRSLRSRATIDGLRRLASAGRIDAGDAETLENGYWFLRRVEHAVQIDHEVQTHRLPDDPAQRLRLARLFGHDDPESFRHAYRGQADAVRKVYERFFTRPDAGMSPLARMVIERREGPLAEWLGERGLGDGARAADAILGMAHGIGTAHVARSTTERFVELLPAVLDMAADLGDPDRALVGLGRFVERYGARSAVFDLLVDRRAVTGALLELFDRSRVLTDIAIRRPELVEELFMAAGLGDRKPAAQLRSELRSRLEPVGGFEKAMDVARRYRSEELFRIGWADLVGFGEPPALTAEMSDLADACLRAGLWWCSRDGASTDEIVVVALGKAGGREIGYGSDLDVVFVSDVSADGNAARIRGAAHIIDFMGRLSAEGRLFPVDARLRPFGDDGSLVAEIGAFESYHRERAQLWERQALVKARVVAGPGELIDRIETLLESLAYDPGLDTAGVEEIVAMRRRIQTERSPAGEGERAFKTGAGGLVDIEFLAQTVQLRYGRDEPALRVTPTVEALDVAGGLGLLPVDHAADLVEHYTFLRRVESAVRIDEDASVSILPADAGRRLAVARALGFRSVAEFDGELRDRRARVRAVYEEGVDRLRSAVP